MVLISKRIRNLEAQPFEIKTIGCHFTKNHLKSGQKCPDWSCFQLVGTSAKAKPRPFENRTIWHLILITFWLQMLQDFEWSDFRSPLYLGFPRAVWMFNSRFGVLISRSVIFEIVGICWRSFVGFRIGCLERGKDLWSCDSGWSRVDLLRKACSTLAMKSFKFNEIILNYFKFNSLLSAI